MSFFEDIGLHSIGLTDDEIARVEAAKPKLDYVLTWVKQHRTVLNELIDVAQLIAKRIDTK